MTKRYVSLFLVLLLAVSAVTLANAELGPWMQSVADKRDASLVDMDKTLEIIWWGFNPNGILPGETSLFQEVIEQRFNIKVNNVQVDNYNAEQVNLLLATGIDFDIRTAASSFSTYADMEIIRPVPVETLEQYAPVIVSLLQEEVGDKWVDFATWDGQVWGIPQVTASWSSPNVMGVRTDWLEAIGYSAENLPTTLEGLEEMLLKFRTDDPDGNGQQDTYALGMSNSYGFYELGAYGVSRVYWYYNDAGELTNYAIDENYREALRLMQRWYALGIYDPEIITDKRDDGVAKFVRGRIAGYTSLDQTFANNAGANLSGVRAALEEGQTIDITFIPPVEGPNGRRATSQFGATVSANGVVFGRNCSDEKLVRLLQIQDAFFADPDLWLTATYGERYVNWDLDENENVLSGAANGFEETYNIEKDGGQRFANFAFMPSTVLKWRLGGVGEPGSRYEIFMAVKDYPVIEPASVSVFKTEADTEYAASCDKIRDEYFLKALTGEADVDATWDGYVASWLSAGGQEILDARRALAESMK